MSCASIRCCLSLTATLVADARSWEASAYLPTKDSVLFGVMALKS